MLRIIQVYIYIIFSLNTRVGHKKKNWKKIYLYSLLKTTHNFFSSMIIF